MIYRERALRHEYKFPATAAQCEILRERFSAVMTPDAHGENGCYRITSVYLDDVYRTAYNDKPVSYTHLDVYKRQDLCCRILLLYLNRKVR